MWLRKLRDLPPTDEEMSKSEAAATLLRSKVAVLDQQDRLRKARQQAVVQPDMDSFLQQLSANDTRKPSESSGEAWKPPT